MWASIELTDDRVAFHKTHWVEAVLANGLWNMLENMSEVAVRQRFVVLAKLFLAEMFPVTEVLKGYTESVQEGFGPIFTACVKMMRGFLGLACPTPGHASLEDVQYIFPSNASTAKLALDLPGGSGRAVISTLRKDKGNFWHDANSEFCLTIGFAEHISAEYKTLERDLAEIIQVLGLHG